MKKLVILVPAFNEEETIGKVILSFPKVLPGIDRIECVVVDDGSTDTTAEVACSSGAFVVSHSSNKGVGAALATGIEESLARGADYMVNIDADGQFDPGEIQALVSPLQQHALADVAVGTRFSKMARPKNMSHVKFYGNRGMAFLIGLLIGKKVSDVSCGFRAYTREALLNLNLFGGFTYTQETFLDLIFKGLNIVEVPITVKYFRERKSRVAGSILRYAYSSSKIIIRTLTFHRPFRFFGYPGIILLFLGVCFNFFLLVNKIMTGAYTPYKAFGFIGGGLMIFGLLMLSMALIADTVDKLKKMQEKTLYYEKRKFYDK